MLSMSRKKVGIALLGKCLQERTCDQSPKPTYRKKLAWWPVLAVPALGREKGSHWLVSPLGKFRADERPYLKKKKQK